MRLQLKQSWGREGSPAWKLFPPVPGLQRGAPGGPAGPAGRAHLTEPSVPARAEVGPAPRPPRAMAAPSAAPGPLGGRRDPAAAAPRGAGRCGGRGAGAGRRAAVPGVGRGAGGGARGVRGRGGVQLSLALLVVTARQAHIPSGSRSLSPFCFPTIELRWKQKIEGV